MTNPAQDGAVPRLNSVRGNRIVALVSALAQAPSLSFSKKTRTLEPSLARLVGKQLLTPILSLLEQNGCRGADAIERISEIQRDLMEVAT